MATTSEKSSADGSAVETLTDGMAQVSVKSDFFTKEERAAFAEVRKLLEAKGISKDNLRDKDIGMITMIEKCKIDKAVKKYEAYINAITEYDMTLKDLHNREYFGQLKDVWDVYHPCGPDNQGRSVMFLKGQGIPIEREKDAVRGGFLYWMAVHSDPVTIREGMTFIIDQSGDVKRVGNENKMQKMWSALPLRPQHFFIVDATFIKRIFINALIKFAALFSSAKVLKRIRFVERSEVEKVIPTDRLPAIYDGPMNQPGFEFVMERFAVSDKWFSE